MKRTTLLSTFLLVVVAAFGQKAQLKVMYENSAPSLATVKQKPAMMTLLCGTEGSYYFSPMSQYVDSMNSTPEGKAKLREIQMKAWMVQDAQGLHFDMTKGNAPHKKIYTYVIKDADKSTVYGKWGDELRYYNEPKSEMQWEMVDDTTANILGYECMMAKADYHGRTWKAWFAPEIPVSDGPWKFSGLPGLILMVEDTDGLFCFNAVGLEKTDVDFPVLYMKDEYVKTDRKKALADEEHYRKNADANLRAKYNVIVMKHVDEDGNEVEAPEYVREKYAMETDF